MSMATIGCRFKALRAKGASQADDPQAGAKALFGMRPLFQNQFAERRCRRPDQACIGERDVLGRCDEAKDKVFVAVELRALRLDIKLLREFGECPLALDGGQSHRRLECRCVVPAPPSRHGLS